MLKRSRRLSLRDLFSISENLVEFRRRSGERNKICFLTRHVRGRKRFSPRKRAKWPLSADILCAAAGCDLFVGKGFAFFDGLTRRHSLRELFVFVRNFYQPLAYMATMFFRISTTLSICSTQASSSGPWKLPAPVPKLGQGRPM